MNSTRATSARKPKRLAVLSAIVVDEEFRGLLPDLSPYEQAVNQESLFSQKHVETLLVWPCQGRRILVVGYDVFPTIKLYRLPFRIAEKEFACRDDVRAFIIEEQLSRRNLGVLICIRKELEKLDEFNHENTKG